MAELFIIIICPLTTFKETDEESPPKKIKAQVIFVILLVIFVQLNPLLTVAVNSPPFPAVCFSPHPVS